MTESYVNDNAFLYIDVPVKEDYAILHVTIENPVFHGNICIKEFLF
jgi:hypothetical protein